MEEITDVGSAITNWWAQYGPLIISFLSSGAFGAIVVGIVRAIVGRLGRKVENNAKTAMLTEAQIKEIASGVAGLLTGSELDVDLSRVVPDAVKDELSEIIRAIGELRDAVTAQNECTALMTIGLGRSALLSDGEKAELSTAANSLERSKRKKQRVRVKIEGDTDASSADIIPAADAPTDGSLINFGG